MIVYAAQIRTCVYESAYTTLSLHTTKKGAYLACRRYWVEQWNDWNFRSEGDGYHKGYPSKMRRKDYDTALAHKAWTVQQMNVIEGHAREVKV